MMEIERHKGIKDRLREREKCERATEGKKKERERVCVCVTEAMSL